MKDINDTKAYVRDLILNGREIVVVAIKGEPVVARRVKEDTVGKTILKDGTIERQHWVAEPGDWVAKGPGGEEWNIKDKTFRNLYNISEGIDLYTNSIFNPKPIPRFCIEVRENISFPDPWEIGRAFVVKKKGFLNLSNPNKIYGIGQAEFKATYIEASAELKASTEIQRQELTRSFIEYKAAGDFGV